MADPICPEERIRAQDFANEYLYHALNIGEQMLISGAEVSRVEDSIRRICRAYGAERVDVFTITSSIVVTLYGKAFGSVTQTRRIARQETDFGRLDRLNQLSRRVCQKTPTFGALSAALAEVEAPPWPFYRLVLIYALISGVFSLFFGGTAADAVVSAAIGMLLCCLNAATRRLQVNGFLSTFLSSFLGGLVAAGAVRLHLAQSAALISIGNIMLLIPGLALTNAIRDLMSGDTISGLLRFCEALLLSMTIALGFALAGVVL